MIRGLTAVDVIAPKAEDETLALGLMLSIARFPFCRGLPIRRLRRSPAPLITLQPVVSPPDPLEIICQE